MNARLDPDQRERLVQQYLNEHARPARSVHRRDPAKPVPLSAEQSNVWFHTATASDALLYNEALTIHHRGPLDIVALRKSMADILCRHEIWRTAFQTVGGELQQIICPGMGLFMPLVDISRHPEPEREDTALNIATADARLPFDLSQAPLMRAKVVRLAPDYHRLYLTLHHLIFDGVSIYQIVLPELIALYAGYAGGQAPCLAEPRLQFADYTLWRAQELLDPGIDTKLEYWRNQLRGPLPVLRLPADRPFASRPPRQGAMETFELSGELTEALKALSRRESVTLYTVLLAAFKALLHRYSGQGDIIIGGVTDMRRRPELAGVVGYFLNSFALRTRPAAHIPFRDYLHDVQSAVIDALDASRVPFDRVVRAVKPDRANGRHPIFQVLFSMEPPAPTLPDGWDFTQMDVTPASAKFDLYLELDERPSGTIGRLLYNRELFDASTIRRMIGHWKAVLKGAVENPAGALGNLPLESSDDRQRLYAKINATERSYPSTTLPEWFEQQAARSPHAVAIACDSHTCTYTDLQDRVRVLSTALRRAGVGRGSLVGVMLDRSVDLVAGLLAILRSGGAYLPLDPQLPPARLAVLLQGAGPDALLTQHALVNRLPQTDVKTIHCDDVIATHDEAKCTGDVACSPDDLAYVLYTSGSTGRPKAVEICHRSLTNLLFAMQETLPFGANDSLLAVTTLSFDIAALELFLPLVSGGSLTIATREAAADPLRVRTLLETARCTVMQATPSLWRALITAGWRGTADLKILCGGEALHPELAGELCRRSRLVLNMYGPTETTIWSTFHAVHPDDCTVPIGRPLPNTTVYVLDGNGELVMQGVAGELYIGGAGVARGYRNDPRLTRERFRLRRSVANERFYRTGDLVRVRHDGLIEFLGRVDNQVKVRGFRVGLEEVEAAINEHPAIKVAAVRVFADATGENSLAAFVVARAQAWNACHEIAPFLRERLPAYMIPSRYAVLQSLPLTANGKIDRSRLEIPQPHETPAPQQPRDDIERMLESIWLELLGVPSVGIHDSFFDVGGHSLLAATMAARIKQHTGTELPLAVLFGSPTIAALADVLRAGSKLEFHHLVQLQSGTGRPLFVVHGIFGNVLQFQKLAEYLTIDRPIYAVQARGADLQQEPQGTIAEMASAYIDAIREVQPEGPYALAGYSFGGLVAFEMACRLRTMGEAVDILALLETDISSRNLTSTERLLSRWMLIRRNMRELAARPPRRWMRFLREKTAVVWRRVVWGRDFIRELDDPALNLSESVRSRNRQLFEIGTREFAAYRPRYYRGTLAIFRTADANDPLLFWNRIADHVEVVNIPGNHGTIMDDPNVANLAAQLRLYLDGVDVAPAIRLRGRPADSATMLQARLGKVGEPAI